MLIVVARSPPNPPYATTLLNEITVEPFRVIDVSNVLPPDAPRAVGFPVPPDPIVKFRTSPPKAPV